MLQGGNLICVCHECLSGPVTVTRFRNKFDQQQAKEVCQRRYIAVHIPKTPVFLPFNLVLDLFKCCLLFPFLYRNVSIPALNDSRYIGVSIYTVVIFSALGVPLSFLLAENSSYSYAIIAGLILFCTTLTLALLFLPKVSL